MAFDKKLFLNMYKDSIEKYLTLVSPSSTFDFSSTNKVTELGEYNLRLSMVLTPFLLEHASKEDKQRNKSLMNPLHWCGTYSAIHSNMSFVDYLDTINNATHITNQFIDSARFTVHIDKKIKELYHEDAKNFFFPLFKEGIYTFQKGMLKQVLKKQDVEDLYLHPGFESVLRKDFLSSYL